MNSLRTENDPKALLVPGAVPILPSVDLEEEENLPSTVDIAALIEPSNDSLLKTWRNTSSIPRARVSEVKRDVGAPNGCNSEESQSHSPQSSENSDSDSSSCCSKSSSTSCSSTDSSSSSDSDSESKSNQSSSGTSNTTAAKMNGVSNARNISNRTSLLAKNNKKRHSASASNSSASASSRSRTNKKSFSVSQSGALTLKISALKILDRKQKLENESSSSRENSPSGSISSANPFINNLDDSPNASQSNLNGNRTLDGALSTSQKRPSFKESKKREMEATRRSMSQDANRSSSSVLCSNSSTTVIPLNNLTVIAANNKIIPVKDRHNFPSAMGSYSPTFFHAGSPNNDHLDPVTRIHKNADLTIFPINPHIQISTKVSNGLPLSGFSIMPSSQQQHLFTNQSNHSKISKRVTNMRRTTEHSDDFDAWDNAETNDAVLKAIHTIDSEIDLDKPNIPHRPRKTLLEKLKSSESPMVGDLSVQRIKVSCNNVASNDAKPPISDHNVSNTSKKPKRSPSPPLKSLRGAQPDSAKAKPCSPKKRLSNRGRVKSEPPPHPEERNMSPITNAITVDNQIKKNKLACLITSISPKSRVNNNNTDLNKTFPPVSETRTPVAKTLNISSVADLVTPASINGIRGKKKAIQTSETTRVNGINKPILTSAAEKQLQMPVKTKAAKKYMGEESELVIPAGSVQPSKKETRSGKSKFNMRKTLKKKTKKIINQEKKKRKRLFQKLHPEILQLCSKIEKLKLGRKSPRKIEIQPTLRRPETFRAKTFTPNDSAIFGHSGNMKQLITKTVKSSSSTPGRKRKGPTSEGNNGRKVVSGSSTATSPEVRLPLKKRHGHHHHLPISFSYEQAIRSNTHTFATKASVPTIKCPPPSKNEVLAFHKYANNTGVKVEWALPKSKKVHSLSPDITRKSKANLSPDITDSRRSVRNRKPKKLDMDEAYQVKSKSLSPVKSHRIKRTSHSVDSIVVKNEPLIPSSVKETQKREREQSPDISELSSVKKRKLLFPKQALKNMKMDIPAGVNVPLPVKVSPTSPANQPKKRRKVNRTGFPNVKKKRKPANSSEEYPISPSASMVKVEANPTVSHEVSIEESENVALETEGKSTKTSKNMKVEKSVPEVDFTPTVTERVKTRRRLSIDGSIPMIAAIYPQLLNVPDPPIILPQKTNYLVAGLFSNFYKTDDRAAERPMKKTPLLPLPSYPSMSAVCGKKVPYLLPYDIWCLGVIQANRMQQERAQKMKEQDLDVDIDSTVRRVNERKRKNQLMPTEIPQSWNFKKMKQNTYYGVTKPRSEVGLDQLCSCPDADTKCGTKDCLNRCMYTECPPACGDRCLNRRIQKFEWAHGIKRFLTAEKGYGVKTTAEIRSGDFILEYVGEVVTDAVFKERMHTIYANDTHHYCLHLNGGMVIDGHRSGSEGRFVNHSCEPNCDMQKWSVNGLSRMALFATRDIEPGEELSYDYNFTLFNPAEGQPCYCGSTQCRGIIGAKKQVNTDRTSKKKSSEKPVHLVRTGASCVIYVGKIGAKVDPSRLKLPKKEKVFIKDRRCFLIRNFEKIRRIRTGEGNTNQPDGTSEKIVEKILTDWARRFRPGSHKNKPPIVPDANSDVADLVRICFILYELFIKLTLSVDQSGTAICNEFMGVNKRRGSISTESSSTDGLDLSTIGNNIIKGRYKSLQEFETALGLSLTATTDPSAKTLSKAAEKVKNRYKELKQQALIDLEPFIVKTGPMGNLPELLDADYCNDVIRCTCGCYDEDGPMIQCDKCYVWQHCDCLNVPMHLRPVAATYKKNKNGSQQNLPRTPSRRPTAQSELSNSDLVKIDDIVININEELPVVLNDEKDVVPTSANEDVKRSCDVVNGSVSETVNCMEVSEMETQKIEIDEPPIVQTNESSVGNNIDVKGASDLPYYCEICQPRKFNVEIPIEIKDSEIQYYKTLRREDGFVLRKGDHVYVLRDYPPDQKLNPDGQPKPRLTYLTAPPLDPEQCDIFKIEHLYKDPIIGPCVFGFHYLRPKETYHEPTRRFYPNELLRSPVTELVPIELIHGRCWVIDPTAYCRGRPVDCEEAHLYICENRVDKSAKIFTKIGKNQYFQIKPFTFKKFATNLKIQRNFHPHGPPSPDFKKKSTPAQAEKGKSKKKIEQRGKRKKATTVKISKLQRLQLEKKRTEQNTRLEKVLQGLHKLTPGFKSKSNQDGNLSFLLTSGRKKTSQKL